MTALLERVTSPEILNHAWQQVRGDRGPWLPGVPMATVARHLVLHIGRLREELGAGTYRPAPVRCFQVAKADGGARTVCAPYVRDKLAQRAVLTVLEPLAEAVFHPASFGYRPMCTLDLALARVREQVRAGYVWLGDADITACFDEIPHRGALEFLAGLCDDLGVPGLVAGWLVGAPGARAGVGLPQGMVLSPLLCNLYLHDMDMDLEEAGIGFVRYADDFIVFGRTEREARTALATAAAALARLGLALNPAKTQVIRTSAAHRFLGKRLPRPRPGIVT